MTSSRPGVGVVVGGFADDNPAATAGLTKRRAPDWQTGRWRTDRPFSSPKGVHIVMRREPGVTGDVLRVPLRFQVPVVGDLQRQRQFGVATFDTLGSGERDRPQGRRLRTLSLDTISMDPIAESSTSGVVVMDGVDDPQLLIRELSWIMGELRGSTSQRFRLTLTQPAIWGDRPIESMLCRLTSLTATQRAGDEGTEYLSLSFQESPIGEIERRRQRTVRPATKIPFTAGVDSLYDVARRSHFARASAANLIAAANGIVGVSYDNAAELAAWARRPGRPDITKLKVPAG